MMGERQMRHRVEETGDKRPKSRDIRGENEERLKSKD
jgi:hypothetical protein